MDTQIRISYLFLFFYFTNIQFPLINLSDFYTLNIPSPTYPVIVSFPKVYMLFDKVTDYKPQGLAYESKIGLRQ